MIFLPVEIMNQSLDTCPNFGVHFRSEGFWQQGRQAYDSKQLEPVLCYEAWYVLVKYDLILNGQVFQGEHELPAQKVMNTYPLIYDALR